MIRASSSTNRSSALELSINPSSKNSSIKWREKSSKNQNCIDSSNMLNLWGWRIRKILNNTMGWKSKRIRNKERKKKEKRNLAKDNSVTQAIISSMMKKKRKQNSLMNHQKKNLGDGTKGLIESYSEKMKKNKKKKMKSKEWRKY